MHRFIELASESNMTRRARMHRFIALSSKSNMVRSTLLHLPARGSLRAKLGGPLVTLFLGIWSEVLMIKKSPGRKALFPKDFRPWEMRWCSRFSRLMTGAPSIRQVLNSFSGNFGTKTWKHNKRIINNVKMKWEPGIIVQGPSGNTTRPAFHLPMPWPEIRFFDVHQPSSWSFRMNLT